MSNLLSHYRNSKSIVHLLYSKNEHTYDEHIKYLLDDLNKNNIQYTEKVEKFQNHGEVGIYFIPIIKQFLMVDKK